MHISACRAYIKWKDFLLEKQTNFQTKMSSKLQGGSNMTGTDLHVNKPHCAAAVRP